MLSFPKCEFVRKRSSSFSCSLLARFNILVCELLEHGVPVLLMSIEVSGFLLAELYSQVGTASLGTFVIISSNSICG